MKQYRKKPVEVEAVQWDGHAATSQAIREWSANVVQEHPDDVDGYVLTVETVEGTMTARPGDWIIRGVKGEFYPCKPDIFEVTYEPVGEPVSA